jgi:hypothetical protein
VSKPDPLPAFARNIRTFTISGTGFDDSFTTATRVQYLVTSAVVTATTTGTQATVSKISATSIDIDVGSAVGFDVLEAVNLYVLVEAFGGDSGWVQIATLTVDGATTAPPPDPTGVIVGAVVGSIGGLLVIALILFIIFRKRILGDIKGTSSSSFV